MLCRMSCTQILLHIYIKAHAEMYNIRELKHDKFNVMKRGFEYEMLCAHNRCIPYLFYL